METKVKKKIVVKKPTTVKEPFIDKLKRNWKNITLILLVLFSMSKCTSSCSRGKQIDRLEYQIVQMDSVITANGIELDKLNTRLGDAQSSIDSYKGIATGNQRELVDKISTLTEEKRNLESQLRKEKSDNEKLRKRITELEKEIEKLNKDTE